MLFSPFSKRNRLQLRISERRLLLMAGDVLAVTLSTFFALYIWSQVAETPFTIDFVLPRSYWFFVLPIFWLILASANDFYQLRVAANRWQSFQRLTLITGQMILVYIIVFFVSSRDELPRLFIFYYGILAFVMVALWRVLNPALLGWASTARRVLIIGTDSSAQKIVETIKTFGAQGYEIRGIISQTTDVGKMIHGVPVIGTGADLMNFVLRDRIAELVITDIADTDAEIFRAVMQAYEQGVVLSPMPLLYARLTGRVPVQDVHNQWGIVLPIEGQSLFSPYPALQRLMDIVLALIGMVVFILLLPVLALIIKLDSRGSIFYTQIRTGLRGKNFRIIKFRTMVQDAEKATGAVFSVANDKRVTRVGRIFRKTRLDELPQIINVLKGDMSIVGPRPERPEHIARLTESIPFYRTRLVIRPGLTGWAQVKYHYGSTDEDALVKLEYDLYYIRNQSLLLDLNIIIRTVYKVIRLGGL
jgi:exopolysaccharide biosynthesis polyprenyl glycosylphosphotransferase